MIRTISVPPLGEQKQTQTLLNTWYVQPGAQVKAGDDVAELVTDKAAFNLPAPEDGRVVRLLAAEGSEVKEGDALAELLVGKEAEQPRG
jgi:pyruvate/2-oxoglutarate dehydrogenase complex dihydrolipoamide acyltransferase (E2) component